MADPQPSENTPPGPPDAKRPEKPAALRKSIFGYIDFDKLFVGSLFGAFADRLYFAALNASTNILFPAAPEDKKGQIQIWATVPLLILYGLSGSLIDSFDRRRLLVLVKALKILVVLSLVPLLWPLVAHPDAELQAKLASYWPWCLGIVVILNAITVPFGPARAAALPDVVPEEYRSLGASLMATSGLISLLLAIAAGSYLAQAEVLGPARTIVLCSLFYALASYFFARLPDSVAVPGNRREKKDPDAAPVKGTAADYIAGLWDGLKYCIHHKSIFGLIFFETIFWTLASAFYILFDFHARTNFGLEGDALTGFSGKAFGTAGIGLFAGAIGVGKIARRASPIVTYSPAFVILAGCLYAAFSSKLTGGHVPSWLYLAMFGIGLSGGSLLGRVDADVLAVTDPAMRGRVFSIKAMAFAATTLFTLSYITMGSLGDQDKTNITIWMPRVFFMLIPIAFIFSWIIDVAIWANKGETAVPGPIHRAGYALARGICWMIFKILFRYEVIGAEKIPQGGPCVLAANHGSFIDPLLLGCTTRRGVQYIMHASYYRTLIHPIFRFLRCIPVEEGGQLAGLKAGVRSLKTGICIGIFPEGHMSDDGQLQRPMDGALFLAQRTGALVVPVAIKGNFQAFPRHAKFPRPSKITAIVGTPFTVSKDAPRKEVTARTDQLMQELAKMLDLPPPPPVLKDESKPDGEKTESA